MALQPLPERDFNNNIRLNSVLLERMIAEQQFVLPKELQLEQHHPELYADMPAAPVLRREASIIRGITRDPSESAFIDIITSEMLSEILHNNIMMLFTSLSTDMTVLPYIRVKNKLQLPFSLPSDNARTAGSCIYLKGGAAYKEYDKYLRSILNYNIRESNFVPNTDDFDIIVSVNNIASFNLFRPIITSFAERLAEQINALHIARFSNLHELGNMKTRFPSDLTLDATEPVDATEAVGTSEPNGFKIFGNILLLSIRKYDGHPDQNWAFRLSLVIDGTYLGTIVEVIVTMNDK
jgi:hypothetical protein